MKEHLYLISTPAYDPDANRHSRGSGASRDGWSLIIISGAMRELLVADVKIHFQALTLAPEEVLRHIGSPFAPGTIAPQPQTLAV